MLFEEKLIKAGKIRQKNLLVPSAKASKAPDTGVTVTKKSAYFVIRDCADVTQKYLPHLIYGSLEDPIKQLKGKFKQSEIIDFVGRSKEDRWTKQLLNIILTDIGTVQYKLATGVSTDVDTPPVTVTTFNYSDVGANDDDVYGDYNDDVKVEEVETVQPSAEVDVDVVTTIIDKLIEVFAAK
jgi:hypothetical protein